MLPESTNEHVSKLLDSLRLDLHLENAVKLVTECGQHTSVPLPLLCLAWPGLSSMLQGCTCCADFTIMIPANKRTVVLFVEMLYSGISTPANSSELKAVRDFCKVTGLNLNIEIVRAGNTGIPSSSEYYVQLEELEEEAVSDTSETFVLKEYYSDEEDEMTTTMEDEALESSTGFVMKGLGPSMLCSRNCTNDCARVTNSWSEAVQVLVKAMFKSEKPMQSRVNLINHLQAQENVGLDTGSFFINGQAFCIKYLAVTTGISDYILRSVLEDYSEGIRMYEHASKGVIQQQSLATIQFISWFKQFVQIYGQDAPDDNISVLAYWLKKAALFKIYKEEGLEPHVAQATFYQHMKTYFGPQRIDKSLPCVRISKYTTHSVCDVCVALNTNQRECKTEAELKVAKSLRNQHRMDFGLARRAIDELKQSAITFPEDNLYLQIDGMDNSKSYLPRYLKNAKELVGAERLPSKISGCIITNGLYEGNQKILFFINHDHFENGSDMVVSIVYSLLQEFLRDHGKFPRKLHLNLDNCWRENKNRFLFSFLASLMQLNIFVEVSCNFLIKGHTGNEVDRLFSLLANQFKSEIVTLEDLKGKILSAPIVPKPICRSLLYTFDWKGFIAEKLCNPALKYQSKYNSFLFTMEKCKVHLRAKKLPQHTELVPRAGIQLIEDNIDFEPVGPSEFRIEKIKFEEIMRGLNKFLSKLPLDRRMTIQTSWDGLRRQLEDLPRRSENLEKMKLADFPKQTQVMSVAVPDHLNPSDDHLELSGATYPEDVNEGVLDEEVSVGMDVVVYTEVLRGRPWVGRIVKLLDNGKFLLQWFTRKTVRSKAFFSLTNPDGSPSLSEIENGSVMFWMMSENRKSDSFTLSPYWLQTIQLEYDALDS